MKVHGAEVLVRVWSGNGEVMGGQQGHGGETVMSGSSSRKRGACGPSPATYQSLKGGAACPGICRILSGGPRVSRSRDAAMFKCRHAPASRHAPEQLNADTERLPDGRTGEPKSSHGPPLLIRHLPGRSSSPTLAQTLRPYGNVPKPGSAAQRDCPSAPSTAG